jgi:hypothetical protein
MEKGQITQVVVLKALNGAQIRIERNFPDGATRVTPLIAGNAEQLSAILKAASAEMMREYEPAPPPQVVKEENPVAAPEPSDP